MILVVKVKIESDDYLKALACASSIVHVSKRKERDQNGGNVLSAQRRRLKLNLQQGFICRSSTRFSNLCERNVRNVTSSQDLLSTNLFSSIPLFLTRNGKYLLPKSG